MDKTTKKQKVAAMPAKEEESDSYEEDEEMDEEDEEMDEEDEEMDEEDEEMDEEDESEFDSEEARSEHIDYLCEYLPGLLHAIKVCGKETDETCLKVPDQSLTTANMRPFFKLLPETQFTQFRTKDNDLRWGMPEFAKQLVKSKIQKLNLKSCQLRQMDVMALMQELKKTNITDLDLSTLYEVQLPSKQAKEFVALLLKSHVTKLTLTASSIVSEPLGGLLTLYLPHSFITHLKLEDCFKDEKKPVKTLFTNLSKTALVELLLGCNNIADDDLKPLKETLRQSKLEKLGLHFNKITDAGVNILVEAAVGSKLQDLIVAMNQISGNNYLGKYLKETNIRTLWFTMCPITSSNMFSFPNFLEDTSITELYFGTCKLNDEIGQKLVKSLRNSEVKKLDLHHNDIGLQTVSELANILKDTGISEIDLSECKLSPDALKVLAESVEGTKLQHFTLKGAWHSADSAPALAFLDASKRTEFTLFDISYTNFQDGGIKLLATSLRDTMLTTLKISNCEIGDEVVDIAPALKYTAITHLNLDKNDLGDVGAKKLAEYLNETKISELSVKDNNIADKGAKALVLCLKEGSLYQLNLKRNKMTDEGMDKLAKLMDGTFITNLKASGVSGRSLPITVVMWRNRLLVHKLISFFKTMDPIEDKMFRFDSSLLSGMDLTRYVEKCLLFYKAAIEQPSALSALAFNNKELFTRDQMVKLILDEFPRQFATFIRGKTDLEVDQHVKFLERAESLGLTKIVELLLGNSVTFVIDLSGGILHPSAYKLLGKYQLLNQNFEPESKSKEKVIQYFKDHPEMVGATDVIKLLTS